MGKLRGAIVYGALGILTGWAYSRIDKLLLILLAGWIVILAVVQLDGFVRFSLKEHIFENRLYLSTGFANPVELLSITLVMTLFSFIAYFTLKPHWSLFVHGGWRGLVTLRQLTKGL